MVIGKFKDLKNRGMSGDTYLFRRSPSIDRLGPDLSKSDRFPTFRDSWSRRIEGDPSIYRLQVDLDSMEAVCEVGTHFERTSVFSICPFCKFRYF